MTQAREGVFAAGEGKQEAAVLGAEAVESLVIAPSVGPGLAHLVEVLGADRRVVQGTDEFEVAAVGGSGETAQVSKAVDALLESIPSNIAEGCGREGDRELTRFLNIASGSAAELEYQLLLARDLAYLSADVHRHLDALVGEVKRMPYRFMHQHASPTVLHYNVHFPGGAIFR